MSSSNWRNDSGSTTPDIAAQRRRVFSYVITLPFFLTGFLVSIFLIWKIAIRWVSAPDQAEKRLYGLLAILLYVVTIILVYFFVGLTRRVMSSIKPRVPNDPRDA